MDLEPDHRRLASLNSTSTERSGVWWATVIAVGVLVGNILSFGVQELYDRWQMKQFMVSVDAMFDKQHQRSMEARKQQAKRQTERQRQAEKERSIRTQLDQTCLFWREQVRKENTSKNRQYRDIACSKTRLGPNRVQIPDW